MRFHLSHPSSNSYLQINMSVKRWLNVNQYMKIIRLPLSALESPDLFFFAKLSPIKVLTSRNIMLRKTLKIKKLMKKILEIKYSLKNNKWKMVNLQLIRFEKNLTHPNTITIGIDISNMNLIANRKIKNKTKYSLKCIKPISIHDLISLSY